MKIRLAVMALVIGAASALSGCEYYGPPPPPPMADAPRRPPVDACGAGAMQYLVGRSISDIPQTYGRRSQRVVANGSIISDLFDPQRLSIFYDEQGGRITRVRCG
jgi:hypothetical protein